MCRSHRVRPARLSFFSAVSAAAQDRPATLSTLFEDIYGPRGLVLNSDDVQLDGTNHAAHFNSAFQSEFRLMNVALTSQLATVPLPSPASGFTYQFDPATGTFVRTTRSFGPILADRGETIGKNKIAFGYTYQFFSFDHLDGIPLVECAGGIHARQPPARRRSSRRRGDREHHRSDGQPVHRRADLRVDGSRRRFAGGAPGPDAAVTALERHGSPHRHGVQSRRALFPRSRRHRRIRDRRASISPKGRPAASATSWRASKRRSCARARARSLPASTSGCQPGTRRTCSAPERSAYVPSRRYRRRSGAFAPHANVAYQWNGESSLAGDVRTGEEG